MRSLTPQPSSAEAGFEEYAGVYYLVERAVWQETITEYPDICRSRDITTSCHHRDL